MQNIPNEMMPGFKPTHKRFSNIFVEFQVDDFESIKKIPGFTDAWEYPNMHEDIIHRREFGWIQTDIFRIRFLGNSSKINA